MLNPYFLQGSSGEQSLVQDLINEQLRMYGVEVYYLPRKYINEKTILKEVIESKFDDAYPIEAYVNNFEGYGDNPTLLSKFGIQATNEMSLIISKERFETYITPLIKNETNIKLSSRPKEGDLIYFPLGDRLFEIKYVEHEKPFYQLQKNYVYELRCELFRYEDEIIDTGVDEIDDILEPIDGVDGSTIIVGSVQRLTLVGTGVTATAETGIVNGGIQFITITNRGAGYLYKPTVGISSAPTGGVTGIATVTFISGIEVCTDSANSATSSIQSAPIVNPGAGYSIGSPPGIRFIGGGGAGAAATAGVENGVLGIVTVTSGGSGYTTAPSITFTGISTVSAAATAVISSTGTLSAIYLTNAGAGYTEPPTITISSPHLGGSGNFVFNETVTGSSSGATARVRSWNSATYELDIYSIDGVFTVGETVTGSESGASRALRVVDFYQVDDGYTENEIIQSESDAILDFTEKNPFGQV